MLLIYFLVCFLGKKEQCCWAGTTPNPWPILLLLGPLKVTITEILLIVRAMSKVLYYFIYIFFSFAVSLKYVCVHVNTFHCVSQKKSGLRLANLENVERGQ